ncbi:pyrroline-5-carboxylate reductase [Pseudahrensia aquimaris]|uniref:Pyrroline-5-carboxylate reductase n=1 Tax=Pseudahrensia aquimaris TaxID=744461 RepID=A0ABW3FHU5_9HYPH
MSALKLCLVGVGNMGGAMLAGWLEAGRDPKSITVIDPQPPQPMADMMQKFGVDLRVSAEGVSAPDVLLVAVKPQIMGAVLEGLTSLVNAENVLVSVAAGTTIAQLAAPFSRVSPRIIRAMPNTPAQVQQGITVCVANGGVSNAQCDAVSDLLAAIGQVAWINDEKLMDAVTGVSGSGPAYVFHLAEALAQAGVSAGLPVELSAQLAQATVSGAGALMAQSDLSPTQLRENVTSPNGTTQAALEVLMAADGFPKLMERAVAAAAQRSEELSKG